MRVFARAAVLFAASFLLAGCDVLTSYLDSISDGAVIQVHSPATAPAATAR